MSKVARNFADLIKGMASGFRAGVVSKRKNKLISVKQHDVTDCGAACIASIAGWYDLDLPIARIRQYASTDKKGTNVLGLIEAAVKIGFTAKGVKGNFEHLPEVPLPVIAHVVENNLAHYIVIYKISKTTIQVMDPAYGELQEISHDVFQKKWTGVLVMLLPGDDFSGGNERISIEQRFIYLLMPHRSVLLQVLAGAVFYTILGLSSSIFLQKIVDNVLPEGNTNLLNLMGIVMIAIIFVQVFINHAKTMLTIKTGQQIDARLILGYYKHLLKLPQQFFDTMRVGEIISRMNDAVKIRAFINEVLVGFLVNVFILIFSFALMFTYYWKLALIMLIVVPLYALIYYFSNKVNKQTQRKVMEKTAELENQLVESVTAVSTIKRFGLEDFANLKTETRFIGLLKTIYTSGVNSLWIGNLSSTVSSLFSVILLWTGASFVLNNLITPGELLSFYAIIGYFTGPVISLIGMNKILQDARIAADRLFEIMDLEREATGSKTDLSEDMIGDISIQNIHFRYGSRVNVFENFSLSIPKGKITAIVGESGSGKTTLLSLLQNIYSLQSGSILIGEYDIKYLTSYSLRRVVGVVPQDVHLFAGNVIDNIAIGDMEPDMKRIIRICKDIAIMDFIEKLPHGFNTYLGENGASLSGGQRQRLAIARALYREPEILILDEATSSLDSASEAYVHHTVDLLRKKGKTIILIAHRLSTVVNADKIAVLKQGRLMEEGSHAQLLEQEGLYAEMWGRQYHA
ncbi:probable bacteriocin/lantibiotic ABC transporter, ATP-binding protein [Pedobacter sp. BAL39]|uniref:peptidase domain-containing ABC transporter n=1 Tax=Pedobacter sp. BAL39 TaxID=391596 RepID=UPI00015597CF|nr:peptidase domain-containing ABC transporter [Pedobacter sp. BAL39]EDM37717.1 probable bacteriocin/lantibiotic ABC transporter, ATP-binding protein [Pedobacter sp. BAL39]